MNKKFIFIIIVVIAVALLFLGIILFQKSANIGEKPVRSPDKTSQNVSNSAPAAENAAPNVADSGAGSQNVPKSAFEPPMDRASERITKKTFGQFITPQNSPVQPEKFRGYHTGTDFEIFPEELNVDVPVKAVCDGKIALKKIVTGYGGVLVESCELNSQPASAKLSGDGPITVIYGHLKLISITKKAGDSLSRGEEIGILGKAYSAETDGERKHLHLGIHKGASVNILGYVQPKAELSDWIDPCSIGSVCN